MSADMVNNQRIAKNTIFLYIRMLFLMAVNLYTSRVILHALGVEDYGIYNAVAGVVAMFSMVSLSISGAISRFLTFALGQSDDTKVARVFCTSLIIQIIIACLVVLLVEIIGVWFLNAKMTIPTGREIAANWLLQIALVTFVFNLWSTPYNACLIAHEKMNAFAFIGIFEGCANLGVAFLVGYAPFDKLIYYALLLCLVAIITRVVYALYCKRHFTECTFRWVFDKSLFKEMFAFAGWNFIGATSGLFRDQGINILFNVYYGPVVNAARGLAIQVQTAVTKFSQSFFTAVKPQIVKSYASAYYEDAHNLVMRSSRLGFIVLMFLIVPIISETEFILNIWLEEVPEHTIAFVRIILLCTLIDSISHPLIELMFATGNIKKYQIVVGSVNLLNFPAAWMVLLFGGSSEIAQATIIIFSLVALLLRVKMLKSMTGFPAKSFLVTTILRCFFLLLLSVVAAVIVLYFLDYGIVRFCISMIVIEGMIIISTYCLGLNKGEKKYIVNKIKSIFRVSC
ncbi:MAG: oligosaccharide flippase family protein [Paludibacteraceae bacterium]|nr:oligosaccharide flippase family protein [Paludibacteraceae bacterium]